MSPKADKIQPYFGNLFKDEPLPKDGYIVLDPSKPGFGCTLNKEELNLRRPYARESSALNSAEKRKAADMARPSHDEWLDRAKKIQKGEY